MIKAIALGMLTAAAMLASQAASAAPRNSAIQSLETVAQLSPSDGGAQIELASAYYQAGRMTEANTAYRAALKLDNVMLETRNGDAIWSHEVARRVLARTMTLSSR